MKDTDARMNRLVGQIEGIRRMINGGQALSRIGLIVLKEELLKTTAKNPKRIEKMLEKIFRI